MSTFIIGDVQGCFQSLSRLLKRCDFNSTHDRLFFVGDIVNRGPRSLEVLAWVYEHRHCVDMVLGNHDLHLLMRSEGLRKSKSRDTIDEILHCPERFAWLEWLRQRPLLYEMDEGIVVHAGLLPDWTMTEAHRRARAVELALQSDQYYDFLNALSKNRRGNEENQTWNEECETVAIMTRMRMVDSAGKPDYKYNGPPQDAPEQQRPWFDCPNQRASTKVIYFGHWAALGYLKREDIIALDSGCVWKDRLTAIRMEDHYVIEQVYCD